MPGRFIRGMPAGMIERMPLYKCVRVYGAGFVPHRGEAGPVS